MDMLREHTQKNPPWRQTNIEENLKRHFYNAYDD